MLVDMNHERQTEQFETDRTVQHEEEKLICREWCSLDKETQQWGEEFEYDNFSVVTRYDEVCYWSTLQWNEWLERSSSTEDSHKVRGSMTEGDDIWREDLQQKKWST